MSDELLVIHGSPTLAGIKTANLFSIPYEEYQSVSKSLCYLNRMFVPKGLRIIPMKRMDKRILVYMYRPKKLQDDILCDKSLAILKKLGYQCDTVEQYIVSLVHRLNQSKEFPHEIGLFLGYPPEDVEGFMNQGAHCSKCCGCWKVYGNEEDAKRKFEQYKACTNIYHKRWKSGMSIQELTVKT